MRDLEEIVDNLDSILGNNSRLKKIVARHRNLYEDRLLLVSEVAEHNPVSEFDELSAEQKAKKKLRMRDILVELTNILTSYSPSKNMMLHLLWQMVEHFEYEPVFTLSLAKSLTHYSPERHNAVMPVLMTMYERFIKRGNLSMVRNEVSALTAEMMKLSSARTYALDIVRDNLDAFVLNQGSYQVIRKINEIDRKHPFCESNRTYRRVISRIVRKYNHRPKQLLEALDAVSSLHVSKQDLNAASKKKLHLVNLATRKISDTENLSAFFQKLKNLSLSEQKFRNIARIISDYDYSELPLAAESLCSFRAGSLEEVISLCKGIENSTPPLSDERMRYFSFIKNISVSRQKSQLFEGALALYSGNLHDMICSISELLDDDYGSFGSQLTGFNDVLSVPGRDVQGSVLEKIAALPESSVNSISFIRELFNSQYLDTGLNALALSHFCGIRKDTDYVIGKAMKLFKKECSNSTNSGDASYYTDDHYYKMTCLTAAALSKLRDDGGVSRNFLVRSIKLFSKRAAGDYADYYSRLSSLVGSLNCDGQHNRKTLDICYEFLKRKDKAWAQSNFTAVLLALDRLGDYVISALDEKAIYRRICVDKQNEEEMGGYDLSGMIAEELTAERLMGAVCRMVAPYAEKEKVAKTLEEAVMLETTKHPKDLDLVNLIADGAYKAVFLCVDVHTRNRYAFKVVKLKAMGEQHIMQAGLTKGEWLDREATVITRLMEENPPEYIARIYEKVREYQNLVCFAEECFDTTLDQHLKEKSQFGNFDYQAAIDFTIQILEGLKWCHTLRDKEGNDNPIIHQDLKLKNIGIKEVKVSDGKSRFVVKITDFGYAGCEGSRWVLAPEVAIAQDELSLLYGKLKDCKSSEEKISLEKKIEELKPKAQQTERSNVFAVGCLMYQMLTGYAPFAPRDENGEIIQPPSDAGEAREEYRAKIVSNLSAPNYYRRLYDSMKQFPRGSLTGEGSKGLRDILIKSLRKNPNERYADAAEFLQAFYDAGYGLTDAEKKESEIRAEAESLWKQMQQLHPFIFGNNPDSESMNMYKQLMDRYQPLKEQLESMRNRKGR